MADMLLDGRTLEFYKWEAGDPKAELLPALRARGLGPLLCWTSASRAGASTGLPSVESLLQFARERGRASPEPLLEAHREGSALHPVWGLRVLVPELRVDELLVRPTVRAHKSLHVFDALMQSGAEAALDALAR